MSSESPDQLRNDEIEARYSNYFVVGYNAFEVVVDFGQLYASVQPRFHTRIVTSPSYAKELLRTLRESLERYEDQFGVAE